MAQESFSIGKGTTITGDVLGEEPLSLEGRLEGSLRLSSSFTIEPTGKSDGDVAADAVTVHGMASGSIEAGSVLTISSIATVTASLRAPTIIIEDGARFTGDIDMDFDVP